MSDSKHQVEDVFITCSNLKINGDLGHHDFGRKVAALHFSRTSNTEAPGSIDLSVGEKHTYVSCESWRRLTNLGTI